MNGPSTADARAHGTLVETDDLRGAVIQRRLAQHWRAAGLPFGTVRWTEGGPSLAFTLPKGAPPWSIWTAEVGAIARFCASVGIDRVLEIGTGLGVSGAAVIAGLRRYHELGSPAGFATLDDWSEGDGALVARLAETALISFGPAVVVTRETGRSPGAIAPLMERLGWTHLDAVLIDGNHGPDQIRADAQATLPLLRPGGLALFHDGWAIDPDLRAELGLLLGTPGGPIAVAGCAKGEGGADLLLGVKGA